MRCIISAALVTLAAAGACGDTAGTSPDAATDVADVVEGTCPAECAEEDGNPCTVPTCDGATNTCVERAVADGAGVASGCYDGIACQGGSPNTSAATLTALGQSCATADAGLDPFGCTRTRCVEGHDACVDVVKPAGAACWPEVGTTSEGATCLGHSCNAAGVCAADASADVVCGDGDFPAGCEVECRACTSLGCHWIPDPNAPGAPAKKVRYCQPTAVAEGGCDDGNGCTTGDACTLDRVASGPLGKETTGLCEASGGKSKDDCLAELELPALPCLRAGLGCDDVDGCALDQDAANAWCRPPAPVCVNDAETYCTHIDVGDGKWNAATGCHLAVYAATCDDGDPCSIDRCEASGCAHDALPDGTVCGPEATCQAGHCNSTCAPIAGGWGAWSCGTCSAMCGGGSLTCTRGCTSPPASCGGAACAGDATMTQACNTEACVDYLPTGTTTYTQGEQVVTGAVPPGTTSIGLLLWGGGGGGGAPGGGGGGAFVRGTLAVQAGDSIELRVGGGGEAENGGGGATYVLKNGAVVMVAGGGGGGGSDGCSGCSKDTNASWGAGGGGGALDQTGEAGTGNGKYGCNTGGGGGGTASTGGAAGVVNDQSPYSGCTLNGQAGSADTGGQNSVANCGSGHVASFHHGGASGGANGSGGGGGAGRFGGGGGSAKYTYCGGGGGGGASWVAPTGVSAVQSQAGAGRAPGNTTTPGYVGDAGRGGQGQTDPFADPLDATPGNPGMIILSL